MQIKDYELTCSACSTQMDFTTVDGRHGYARYRWGVLDIYTGPSFLDRMQNMLVSKRYGEPLAGEMNPDTMLEYIKASDEDRKIMHDIGTHDSIDALTFMFPRLDGTTEYYMMKKNSDDDFKISDIHDAVICAYNIGKESCND